MAPRRTRDGDKNPMVLGTPTPIFLSPSPPPPASSLSQPLSLPPRCASVFLGRWWQKASKNIRAFPPAPRRTRNGDKNPVVLGTPTLCPLQVRLAINVPWVRPPLARHAEPVLLVGRAPPDEVARRAAGARPARSERLPGQLHAVQRRRLCVAPATAAPAAPRGRAPRRARPATRVGQF